MGQTRAEDKTEERAALVHHIASDEQKGASAGPAKSSCQPSPLEAAFATAGLAPKLPERRSAIHLLYDSFARPAPMGIRSAGLIVRQMLYRAGPYQIDIQIEAQADRNRVIVTGQLLDVGHPETVSVGMQVTLSDARGNMVNTVTNQFGEFRGEVKHSGDLELTFLGRDGKSVVILLRGALDPMSRTRS